MLSRLPGIRFVERVAERTNAAEPGLQAATAKGTPWEWQFTAAREDRVPDWVERAASSVTIAVVDTGADVSAPDIAAKNPTTYSPRTGTAEVRDTVGHGTFVAALAAGSVTNGEGIAGFGGDAKLMIIKAGAGDGSISDVDEAAAISYAVDHGARIINLSFGGTTTSTTEKNAIDYATSHGVLVVAAGGNHYLNGNQTIYPAALVQPLESKGMEERASRSPPPPTRAHAPRSRAPARTSPSPHPVTECSRPSRPRLPRRTSRACLSPDRSTGCTATGAARRSPRRRFRAQPRS